MRNQLQPVGKDKSKRSSAGRAQSKKAPGEKTPAAPPSGQGRGGLTKVGVPRPLQSIFLKAEAYVDRYFSKRTETPSRGIIEISGERYILVRAASMSKEFFDLVTSLYQDRGEKEARNVTVGFLFDIAHAIGKADARSFFKKMKVSDPIARLSAGPIHFSHTGWAFVRILPESRPVPDENYFLIYDHPFSFEADTWTKTGERTDFPVCFMNAGYSSGWCEESFGIPLVAAEIECRSKGDAHCRFIMAPPAKIRQYIDDYSRRFGTRPAEFGSLDIPEFFRRKRLEDELKRHRDRLEELVDQRTQTLTQINEQLRLEIASRKKVKRALQKSEIMLEAVFDQTFQFIGILDLKGNVVKINKTAMAFAGTQSSEVIGRPFWQTPWWSGQPAEQKRLRQAVKRAAAGSLVRFETTHPDTDGQTLCIDFSLKPVKDNHGQIVLLIAEGRDISELKRVVDDLQTREAELQKQSRSLEEANIAMKVVLRQVEERRREDKEKILANLKQLVSPYVKRLRDKAVSRGQAVLIDTIAANLDHISSSLVSRLSSHYLNLTPVEIRIAHLVKEGLTNKEIAELLGVALNTVSSHRFRIRSKLGLKKNGTNLRSYLLSLEE